jgi:hypothetical protein
MPNRRGAQQVSKTPPRDSRNRRILHPGKQQQQAENGLDVDRHHEEGIDVETRHCGTRTLM